MISTHHFRYDGPLPSSSSAHRCIFSSGGQRVEELRALWAELKIPPLMLSKRQCASRSPFSISTPSYPVNSFALLVTKNYSHLRPSKLHALFVSPFKILARSNQPVATLDLLWTWRLHPTIHTEKCKPFIPRPDAQ